MTHTPDSPPEAETGLTARRDFLKKAAIAGAGATAAGSLLVGQASATSSRVKKSANPRPLAGESSLGGNIGKALFLTINVSDLDRVVEFSLEARSTPVKRAEVMDGRNSVDLLEWQKPRPYGVAYRRANNLGMMNLTYEVNSVKVVYEKLLRILPHPKKHIIAPPETWDLGAYGVRKTLNIVDPDGTRYQFMERVYSKDPTP